MVAKGTADAYREDAAHAARRVAIDALQAQNYVMRYDVDRALKNADSAAEGLEHFAAAIAKMVDGKAVPRNRTKKDDRSGRKYSTRTARSRSRTVRTPQAARRR